MSAEDQAPQRIGNLGMRLIMSAVMIPLALVTVWYGGWPMVIVGVLLAAVMAYEWASMSDLPRGSALIAFAGVPVVVFALYGLSAALLSMWGLGFLAALAQGQNMRAFLSTLLGSLYTSGIPLAFIVLREGDWNGLVAALMMMGMVWASDSGAYFSGRTFGGPLLSPKDSPNKTWSGAIGAVICTMICGLAAAYILKVPPFRWLAFGAGLSVVAQYGDMIESRIKRGFGAKDASKILPGHGGVMDRLDGLGAVAIVGASVFLLYPSFASFMGF